MQIFNMIRLWVALSSNPTMINSIPSRRKLIGRLILISFSRVSSMNQHQSLSIAYLAFLIITNTRGINPSGLILPRVVLKEKKKKTKFNEALSKTKAINENKIALRMDMRICIITVFLMSVILNSLTHDHPKKNWHIWWLWSGYIIQVSN